jgi:hypothetical protein
MQRPADPEPGEGDAAQAFEDLRAEVSVLRKSLEALTDQWDEQRPSDYTVTLGKIAKGLAEVGARLDSIEGHPALKMTPAQHQQAIAQAGSSLMNAAVTNLDAATRSFAEERQNIADVIGTAYTKDRQLKNLVWTGAAVAVWMLILSPFIAHALPFGIAGRVAAIVESGWPVDRWQAGSLLLQEADPSEWDVMTKGSSLVKAGANSKVLATCREAAAKAKKEQPCVVVVAAP